MALSPGTTDNNAAYPFIFSIFPVYFRVTEDNPHPKPGGNGWLPKKHGSEVDRSTRPMPERIDRDPEEVATVLMQTPIKDTRRWNYLEPKEA